MADEQDLLRKIGLLLKKAEGTDNEHEASAFFEKAHELMVRYAIDEARVRAEHQRTHGRPADEPVVEDYMFSSYAHHAKAKEVLLSVAAGAQSVRSLPYSNRKFSNAHLVRAAGLNNLHESQWTRLVGYKNDIEHVKLLYLSLLIQSQRFAQEDWRARYGDEKSAWTDDGRVGKFMWMSGHMEGFAYRIGERFKELTEDIYRSTAGANALIVDKDANILEWMYAHGLAVRPRPPVYRCWTSEPEANRPLTKAGTLSKKWEPSYCIKVKPSGDEPHEGEHAFTYQPEKYRGSSYVSVGRRESSEGRNAGRSAANRADIGLTRVSSTTKIGG